ncbi:MAG TPA: heme exporter protein CcmB [bacterium]|nr:heme exporter protein CcmB [bacterium]
MGVGAGQVWVLLWKDLLIDLRRKENIVSMFFFALLTLLIFNFAVGSGEGLRYRITPRVLSVLSSDGVTAAQVQALSTLEGRTFTNRSALLAALDALPGGPASGSVRIAVLEQSVRGFLQESAAGLLWVTLLLAGVLGLSKSFTQEREQGCIDGLLLTPVSRGVIYLGKMLSNTLFLVLILALLLPLFSLFFGVGLRGAWLPLAAVLFGGTLGFAALGTLLGGITASLKGREVLLPILLFPLLVPLVVVVVHLSSMALDGQPITSEPSWLELLAAFDAVFLIVSYLVFEYVMES